MELSSELARISRLLGQGNAVAALQQCRFLLERHPESHDVLYFMAVGCVQQERLFDADEYLTRALRIAPGSTHILNELGIVRLKQRNYTEAIDLFSQALNVDRNYAEALGNLAAVFRALLRPDEEKSYLERLIRVQPFKAEGYVRAADNRVALGEVEQAIRLGRRAVRLAPASSSARLSLAEALEAAGRFKQARFEYLSTLGRNQGEVAALAKLLALRGSPLSEQYAVRAQLLLQRGELKEAERAQLQLGLAAYYDQRQEYDQAFEYARAANEIKAKNHPFDYAQFDEAVDRIMGTFSAEFLRASLPRNEGTTKPVFIVGMPRSGTTLVEQILASHSRIQGGGELPTMINIAAQVGELAGRYPEGVRELDKSSLSKLAGRYLDRLDGISKNALRVTDKMPFNFLHLGLISLLLPGARVVHCRRDTLDTCVSCYFTGFNEHLQFASDLEGVGRYYLAHHRLMEHWRAVLPLPMLTIDYERIVSSTEETVRDLLEFCEVEWEPGCMQFHRTAREVRTPSRWQVRQPIYSRSVGRWRHYERHLEPLIGILAHLSAQPGTP